MRVCAWVAGCPTGSDGSVFLCSMGCSLRPEGDTVPWCGCGRMDPRWNESVTPEVGRGGCWLAHPREQMTPTPQREMGAPQGRGPCQFPKYARFLINGNTNSPKVWVVMVGIWGGCFALIRKTLACTRLPWGPASFLPRASWSWLNTDPSCPSPSRWCCPISPWRPTPQWVRAPTALGMPRRPPSG